jgi:C4-dicarboxylate-specific signal transduction histidine kinase
LRSIQASELVADVEAILQSDFTARGIAYARNIQPPELIFPGDPELLSQALLNLLRNAAEAVAAVDTPVIELSCEKCGSEVACIIADNGPGIPADRLQEIFVAFFTTKATGTGIGLTLARQIALAHGGRIEALSTQVGGALFRMILPGRP